MVGGGIVGRLTGIDWLSWQEPHSTLRQLYSPLSVQKCILRFTKETFKYQLSRAAMKLFILISN